MPIYEFVCNKCSNKFEKLLPMNDGKDGVFCPKCNGEAHKVFSTFATISSGSAGSDMDFGAPSGGGGGCSSCSTPSSCSTCGH